MCVSVAPARFANTIVYAGEIRRDGAMVHAAGYQNVAQSHATVRDRWARLTGRSPHTGNAMCLHFPAVPGSMTQANVVDTEGCLRILRDMVAALQVTVAAKVDSLQPTRAQVEVFESGIYTVALASDARAIVDALDRIPDRKRPPLNPVLFDWYHATFPGWPVALCCFDNTERALATPMLWWYEPAHREWLFAPAVDAHTGAVPDLSAPVPVDHWVVAGSSEMEEQAGSAVHYRDAVEPELAAYLPDRVVGSYHRGRLPNADFVIPVEAVRAGRPAATRALLRNVA